MLNTLELGTAMSIHRHRNSSEAMFIIRGCLVEFLYEENGNPTNEILMRPDGENLMIQLKKG